MTLSTALRNAARSLITTFGNTVSSYTYSTATTTENEEGDISGSDWGTASSVSAVDGANALQILSQVSQGIEALGDDEQIFRDDVVIAIYDVCQAK